MVFHSTVDRTTSIPSEGFRTHVRERNLKADTTGKTSRISRYKHKGRGDRGHSPAQREGPGLGSSGNDESSGEAS